MMTLSNKGKQGRHLLAAALWGAIVMAGGAQLAGAPAQAQAVSAAQGVQPWQAQRAVEDYINRFLVAQKDFGRKKFGSNAFSVRVKVDGLTRVVTKDLGVMWVAQFSGAILPTQYAANSEQGFAHAILKIYFDKKDGVRVVVNEGQGVWTMKQKTSVLYDDLPEKPGSWKEWGGPGAPPEPPNEVAVPTLPGSAPALPPSSGGKPSSGPRDKVIADLAAKVQQLGARVAALKKQGPSAELMQAQAEWEAAYKKYNEAMQAPR